MLSDKERLRLEQSILRRLCEINDIPFGSELTYPTVDNSIKDIKNKTKKIILRNRFVNIRLTEKEFASLPSPKSIAIRKLIRRAYC